MEVESRNISSPMLYLLMQMGGGEYNQLFLDKCVTIITLSCFGYIIENPSEYAPRINV